MLSQLAVPPGASVTATGEGCSAGIPVQLSIGQATVGQTTADTSGRFQTPVVVGALPVGRYQVDASCGTVLSAPIDIVLASQVDPDTSTLAIIVFVLLVGLGLFRRQLRVG